MTDLDHIMVLTERVEALVADGRWLDASRTESERQEALARYVAQSKGRPDGLVELYERNGRMLAAVKRSREELIEESSRLAQGKRALRAYRAQSRSQPKLVALAGDPSDAD